MLEKAAHAGSPEAMFYVAVSYDNGYGVKQSDTQQFNWFLKAAEVDVHQGMENTARNYKRAKGTVENYQEALKWYQKAVAHENANAMIDLGFMYERGFRGSCKQ